MKNKPKLKGSIFCPVCDRNIKLIRANFDHIYHELLCFLVILTLGIGLFFVLIVKYLKKKNTCPNCESIFDLESLELIKPEEFSENKLLTF